jgi:hypothetical protein
LLLLLLFYTTHTILRRILHSFSTGNALRRPKKCENLCYLFLSLLFIIS